MMPPVLMARLSAKNGEAAVGWVRAAFEGEPFTVEDAAREEGGRPG